MISEEAFHIHLFIWHLICRRCLEHLSVFSIMIFETQNLTPQISFWFIFSKWMLARIHLTLSLSVCVRYVTRSGWFECSISWIIQWRKDEKCFCFLINEISTDWTINLSVALWHQNIVGHGNEICEEAALQEQCLWFCHIMKFYIENQLEMKDTSHWTNTQSRKLLFPIGPMNKSILHQQTMISSWQSISPYLQFVLMNSQYETRHRIKWTMVLWNFQVLD